MKNKFINNVNMRVSALTLSMFLAMSGCGKGGKIESARFDYKVNEYGEIVAQGNIDYEFLDNYYVVEVYNTITNEPELYIANKTIYEYRFLPTYSIYENIFNEVVVCYDDEEKNNDLNKNGLVFVKETPLLGYINSYYSIKKYYSYEDIQEIYELVLENYEFEENSKLSMRCN